MAAEGRGRQEIAKGRSRKQDNLHTQTEARRTAESAALIPLQPE